MRRDKAGAVRLAVGATAVGLVLALGAVASVSVGATLHGNRVVTVGFGDKGSTVNLRVGETLRVVLDSTYWSIKPSSNANVLAARGVPVVAPRLVGCVPGQGCGTTTALFRALAPGVASISASRASCGEAMRCTLGNGSFKVTVRVQS
jgi:hypothetical protein